jgi:hypothetical protein
MRIERKHLLINDYVWNNDNKITLLSEGATRKRFDRFSGDCMLQIINLFDYYIGELTIAQAQRIECLIQKELPLEAKSEVTVLQWLKEKRMQIFDVEVV